jgi:hypothetical protein
MGNYADYQTFVAKAMDNFRKANFGSPVEAKVGGGYAAFRASDSIDHVSAVIASEPVSLIARYPDVVNTIRSKYGLDPLNDPALGDIPGTQGATPIGGTIDPGVNADKITLSPGDVNPNSANPSFLDRVSGGGWFDSLVSYGNNIAWFVIGISLLIGGLFLLAYSNPTVKTAVNTAAKKGMEAAAA